MYTDQELNKLNQHVYFVDPEFNNKVTYTAKTEAKLSGKEQNHLTIGNREFKIVASANVAQNGYQGFAVAPVTAEAPDGDINDAAIISAGTTPPAPLGEGSDGITDFITAISGFNTANGGSVQTAQADLFVNYVINDLGYTVTQLSGYSQSAYMLKIGAKYHLPTTVFNGWFLYDCLNKAERKYIQKHPEMFRNYRKIEDVVVNYLDGNNRMKINDFGTIFWLEGSSHSLKDWVFDESGQLIFPQSVNAIAKMSMITHQAALDKLKLSNLRKKFTASCGSLSANEKIYLNDSEALILLKTAQKMNQTIITDLKKTYEAAETQAEILWQKADRAAQMIGTHLSTAEVATSLAIGGVSKTTVIYQPVEEYYHQMTQLTDQMAEYERLIAEIQTSLAKLIAKDQELAQQIHG